MLHIVVYPLISHILTFRNIMIMQIRVPRDRHRESLVRDDDGLVTSVLVLSSVQQADGGHYTCAADNSHGKNSMEVLLVVHGKWCMIA